MEREGSKARVGLTILAALAILAVAILVIGEQTLLFSKTIRYFIQFRTVSGLASGSPVQLNGVEVGRIDRIVLPREIESDRLTVWIEIERRYENRIRADSVARIKSLGLLGDKFIEVTTGSSEAAVVPPEGEIRAAQPTDVDALIQSGENVADNIVSTAQSLSAILERMERGEGLLGELVAEREGREVTDSLLQTLESIERVADKIDSGQGVLGRLVSDEQLGNDVSQTIERLSRQLDHLENGEGLLPRLIHDPDTAETFDASLTDLRTTLGQLSEVADELRSGDGLLPRLLNDAEYGEELSGDLRQLIERLNEFSGKINEGDGSVARLVNDPEIALAINDILVGVNESKILRWLIRNRQKKGIEKRYEEALEADESGS